MIGITADQLRAMAPAKAVVAFLRACRTFDDVGDIDGPWRDPATKFLDRAGFAPGCTTLDERLEWERRQHKDEVFAIYDRAIAAAKEAP